MSILIPIVAVTAIGILCAIVLVIASKFMAVKEDDTFLTVRECLPGANCGACGYTGCDGYAHALADGVTTETNLCIPGGAAAAAQVAAALGQETQLVEPKYAFIACCGDLNCKSTKHDYRGISSCAAANLLYSGYLQCYHSCLGLGDCAKACPHDAICVQDGLAQVRLDRCVGCGLCAKACPNKLIYLVPRSVKTVVRCRNHEKGVYTRKGCTNGCIGCKKCEKVCPSGAITVERNCATIDYTKCTNCGKCREVCATGCITTMEYHTSEKSPIPS